MIQECIANYDDCSVFVFASCSSAYKTTQTPDDVYYSPGKAKEYASANNTNR